MTEKKRHRTGIIEVPMERTRYCHQRHQHKWVCAKTSSKKIRGAAPERAALNSEHQTAVEYSISLPCSSVVGTVSAGMS